METLNHHYLTARGQVAPRTRSPYRIFLRAHLLSGYHLPMDRLRTDITEQVPALSELSYGRDVTPLARSLQSELEQSQGVRVRSVDVEVQYRPD